MPMGTALRRTLSVQAQIQERSISGKKSTSRSSDGSSDCSGSVGSGNCDGHLLHNGGGSSVVLAVKEKTHDPSAHSQENYASCLTKVAAGMGCPTLFSAAPLPRSISHSDNLFSIASLSFILARLLRFMGRTGSASIERPVKSVSRSTFLKRPLLHLLLCLMLGIGAGFSSMSWSDHSPPSSKDDTAHELPLVNEFVSNLRKEGGRTVNQEEKLITYESFRLSASVDNVGELSTSVADNLRALRAEQLGSGSLELIPGRNYTLDPQRKLLIIVTPTYNRAYQAHYLTRLAHTLRLVPPPLLWLVVEMPFQTLETASFLRQTGIMYRHLVWRDDVPDFRDRAAYQRNFALKHIEMHQLNGIVYFADDDNIYSQDLFEEMRKIRRFGTFPVGMVGDNKAKVVLEGPVCEGERVIGWHTNEKSRALRRFHVNMAGFAFNSTILWDTTNWRHRSAEPIRQLYDLKEKFLQETTFMEQLVEDEGQMEGLPTGCSKVMVWHVHMEAPELAYPYGWSLANPLYPNVPLQTRT